MLLMLSLDLASSQKEAEERLDICLTFTPILSVASFFLRPYWGPQFAPPLPPPFQRLSANDYSQRHS